MSNKKVEFNLLVGSNNQTKKVEIAKINRIAKNFFNGYNITHNNGFWNGISEQSVVLSIITDRKDKDKVKQLGITLLRELKQYEILLTNKPIDVISISDNQRGLN